MARKNIVGLGVLLACLMQIPAQAINLKWAENAPVRFFSDEDWALATAATNDALANPEDGKAVDWRNPDTGNSGSATAMSTMQRDNKTCRELALENQAKGKTSQSTFLYCLQPDGEWKIEQPIAKPSGQN